MATAITVLLQPFFSTPPCFSVKNLVNNNYTTQMSMYHHHHHHHSTKNKNKNKNNNNNNKNKKAFSIEIRSSSICSRTRKNKIFEDQPKGIICFRDELTGEITCEGYDEGPRSPNNYHQRDAAEIIDLLLIHKTWNQLVINGMGGDQTQTAFPNHHAFTYWDN
ncbi:uncharacterized protein LOC124930745 [Impatiens glandulifera]|uniref:uncharacterized protein LOC124930745 n=1 Tax=Impatiens glandulifera TaxID=253017 RepID=UPI001FB0A4AC|nr:uncharacterized protein LOC124930745 [Impatiens glandulifera]